MLRTRPHPARRLAACVALAAALVAPAARASDLYRVPSQVPHLQQAIDLASAGDRIVVDGGTWGPIVIDEPVRIVGVVGNRPTIRGPVPGETGAAAVTLAGPGVGLVVLGNVEIGGEVDGTFFGSAHAGIAGGGFDELLVVGSTVEAGAWVMPTGLGDGAHGIDVDVPLLVLESCTVTGGAGTDDLSGLFTGSLPASGDGLRCTGRVVMTSCWIRGGAGFDQTVDDPVLCTATVSLCELFPTGEGDGGTAVVAGSVLESGSIWEGGDGTALTCTVTGDVCSFADGALVDSPDVESLPSLLLTLPDTPWPGASIALVYSTPGGTSPVIALAASLEPSLPLAVGAGELYMDPASVVVKYLPGSTGVVLADLAAPTDPRLAGTAYVLQVWDPASGLSAPRHGVFSDLGP